MKNFTISFLAMMLVATTFLFATGTDTSTIVTDDKTNEVLVNCAGASDIIDLSASSSNGLHVCNFKIKSLPAAEAGVLYMADCETEVEVNQNLTESEANGLTFDPKCGFVGTASFTYSGIDVNTDEGTVATVTLPIISGETDGDSDAGGGDETTSVTTDDKTNPEMLNSLPAVDILDLSGKDANGVAVSNFIIKSLVDEEAGTLYMADGTSAVVVEQNLSKDEADGLKFDPKEEFIGEALFTYEAVDVNGELGNVATVTIPVVGTLTPDHNGTDADCICNDYNESLPVLSNFGLFLMMILTSLLGLLFVRKEI